MNDSAVGTVCPMAAADISRPERDDDLCEQVRNSVLGHTPADAAEEASIATFLAEFDRLTAAGFDPFDQRDDPVHVTGSAIVVGPRGVILLKHKRLGMWLQPGGHVDPGETPWAAALREAAEETGLPVTLVTSAPPALSGTAPLVAPGPPPLPGPPALLHVDVHAGGRGHTHLDLRYLVHVDTPSGDAEPAPPAGESPDVHWFDWADAVARATDDRLQGLLTRLTPADD